MHNVSNVPNIANHATDTPMNDGPNVSLNGTNNHAPEEKGGDGIAEGSPDDVEGNINNKWVDMIEETKAVFEGDDDDNASEGSVPVDNPVYPNKGNPLADEDDQIAEKIKYLMKDIDSDQ